jgi:Cupin domain
MTGFPGGTSVSLVTVYDWPAPDGRAGGSPHLHTASTEGYVVLRGDGVVETLSAAGYEEHQLSAGHVVWFTPGTVHRLVNGGDLQILVVMQNAGLPESGDAVFTFPGEVLADRDRYRAAAALPAAAADDELAAAARKRRDLALAGYQPLRDRIRAGDSGALAELHRAAAALVSDRVGGWRQQWRRGPLAQATATGGHLDGLEAVAAGHLATAAVYDAGEPTPRFGMCGRLQTWNLAPSA